METLQLLVVTVVVDMVAIEMEVLTQQWAIGRGVRHSET